MIPGMTSACAPENGIIDGKTSDSEDDLKDMFGSDDDSTGESEEVCNNNTSRQERDESSDQDLLDMFGESDEDFNVTAKQQPQNHQDDLQTVKVPRKNGVAKKKENALLLGKRMAKAILEQQEKKQQVKANKLARTSITTRSEPIMRSQDRNVYYRPVSMDHYFKNLMEWDFVRDLNKTQQQQLNTTLTSSETEGTALPDTFSSVQEYKAKWSPLLLQEVKSQILSELSSEIIPHWSKGQALFPVIVESLSATSCPVANQVTLVIRTATSVRGGNNAGNDDKSFINDAYVLVADSRCLFDAANGKLDQNQSRLGIVGLATNRVTALDGLNLTVSLRIWRAMEKRRDMFITKVGSSITSQREFVALCQMEKILLKKSLLEAKAPLEATLASEDLFGDLLTEQGGDKALGIGFRIYIKSKFNPSQIRAITAAAREYGHGGFTLVKGPPGTGKTTTLVALLNAIHLKQYQIYYQQIERIATQQKLGSSCTSADSINAAAQVKPRILVCAPSNAAVDNVIVKITKDGFVDGNGGRYNPSIVRVGNRQSTQVNNVSLRTLVDQVLAEGTDQNKLESLISYCKTELKRFKVEINKVEQRLRALVEASPKPLSSDWEIRIDEETFDHTKRVLFVNHRLKETRLDAPLPAGPGEEACPTEKMPHYRSLMDNLVKYVERYSSVSSKLRQYKLVETTNQCIVKNGRSSHAAVSLMDELETHLINNSHIVMTTLGSAGSKKIESAQKFAVVVVDEAAQCSEPATLIALQLGSSQAVLMGDPQQLPATVFSLSGRNTKYGRSLFQRLEEAGHPVHMLNTQYRMNPAISDFPRRIFYDGTLLDGRNVKDPQYGGVLNKTIRLKFPTFKPFTILDLGSSEARDGTSLSNSEEVDLALHLYNSLEVKTSGMLSKCQVAVITPYSRQAALLKQAFTDHFGPTMRMPVEISTIDAFQGKEADVVIFSCVRAATGGGIGFLSDVQRMNVALTRAKHYLFVIASIRTIVVNPYWKNLVEHARECGSIFQVSRTPHFPDLSKLTPLGPQSVSSSQQT